LRDLGPNLADCSKPKRTLQLLARAVQFCRSNA
jgi:hypothetical protein